MSSDATAQLIAARQMQLSQAQSGVPPCRGIGCSNSTAADKSDEDDDDDDDDRLSDAALYLNLIKF